MSPLVDEDLVALYADEHKLSAMQVRPFIHAGLEPPNNADGRVDRIGFTFAQRAIMDAFYTAEHRENPEPEFD